MNREFARNGRQCKEKQLWIKDFSGNPGQVSGLVVGQVELERNCVNKIKKATKCRPASGDTSNHI